ncbi:MAG: hypothetical protein ACPG8W_02265 [Candidatus Promineifilaceae bacterium]
MDLHLERIAGGNESEVYRTDDARFVVKLKNEPHTTSTAALHEALELRAAAKKYADIVGPECSVPSYFLVASDDTQRAYVIIVQPYLKDSLPLFYVDYATLSPALRRHVATQLQTIIRRSLTSFWHTGIIPDIYGRSAASPAERIRRNSLSQLPARLWSFLARRTLLRAHNLLLTPEQQIQLIDYDPVRRSALYKRTYYTIRVMLFIRDIFFIWVMKHTGWAY